MIKHILVAVDGSEGSRRAAALARELAEPTGARLTLLHVLEPAPVISAGFAEFYGVSHRMPTDEETEKLHSAMHAMIAGFPRDRAEEVVEYGPVPETIVEQAQKRSADLIVIGARGMGPLGRFLVGSTSDRVVHLAKTSVTVVH